MTAGLLLDICGIFLITKHLLFNLNYLDSKIDLELCNMTNETYENYMRQYDFYTFHTTMREEIDNDARKKHQRFDIRYGFVFASVGFFLILIASWINYLKDISL